MTECAAIREELLDAAPDELAGIAATALATHVRHCPRCGPLARLFLDEQARLGMALSLVQPRLSAAAAADDILVASPVADSVGVPARETRGERFARFAATVFPMAAAAALAAYLVYGTQEPVPHLMFASERPAREVRITAMPGTGTIVLNTADPDITFAWIGKEIVP
jgi:hypothetical protein